MGRILLICRLVVRDLRRRPVEAVLALLAITAATATLALGLAMNGVASQPYQRTWEATAGPDVVAQSDSPAGRADLKTLMDTPAVTGRTGPYPVGWAILRARGLTAGVMAEGRDQAPASIDQPELTQGSWVRNGGAVIEQSFADALGIRAGDQITLDSRSFRVTGIAVTAAIPAYPNVGTVSGCAVPC